MSNNSTDLQTRTVHRVQIITDDPSRCDDNTTTTTTTTTNNNSRPRNSNGRPKRGQANKRERVRTENVNAGFENLRKLIPTEPEDRKLSKIEVLRLATSYINHLYNLTKAK